MLNQTLGAQAQIAYDAALNSPWPDWRAVAELFRAAMQAERVKRMAKATAKHELAEGRAAYCATPMPLAPDQTGGAGREACSDTAQASRDNTAGGKS